MRVWGDPGGSGGSYKHIWKIFYRGLFEIGTPGTPRGPKGPNFIFQKFSPEKLLGYTLPGLGVVMVKSDFEAKNCHS